MKDNPSYDLYYNKTEVVLIPKESQDSNPIPFRIQPTVHFKGLMFTSTTKLILEKPLFADQMTDYSLVKRHATASAAYEYNESPFHTSLYLQRIDDPKKGIVIRDFYDVLLDKKIKYDSTIESEKDRLQPANCHIQAVEYNEKNEVISVVEYLDPSIIDRAVLRNTTRIELQLLQQLAFESEQYIETLKEKEKAGFNELFAFSSFVATDDDIQYFFENIQKLISYSDALVRYGHTIYKRQHDNYQLELAKYDEAKASLAKKPEPTASMAVPTSSETQKSNKQSKKANAKSAQKKASSKKEISIDFQALIQPFMQDAQKRVIEQQEVSEAFKKAIHEMDVEKIKALYDPLTGPMHFLSSEEQRNALSCIYMPVPNMTSENKSKWANVVDFLNENVSAYRVLLLIFKFDRYFFGETNIMPAFYRFFANDFFRCAKFDEHGLHVASNSALIFENHGYNSLQALMAALCILSEDKWVWYYMQDVEPIQLVELCFKSFETQRLEIQPVQRVGAALAIKKDEKVRKSKIVSASIFSKNSAVAKSKFATMGTHYDDAAFGIFHTFLRNLSSNPADLFGFGCILGVIVISIDELIIKRQYVSQKTSLNAQQLNAETDKMSKLFSRLLPVAKLLLSKMEHTQAFAFFAEFLSILGEQYLMLDDHSYLLLNEDMTEYFNKLVPSENQIFDEALIAASALRFFELEVVKGEGRFPTSGAQDLLNIFIESLSTHIASTSIQTLRNQMNQYATKVDEVLKNNPEPSFSVLNFCLTRIRVAYFIYTRTTTVNNADDHLIVLKYYRVLLQVEESRHLEQQTETIKNVLDNLLRTLHKVLPAEIVGTLSQSEDYQFLTNMQDRLRTSEHIPSL